MTSFSPEEGASLLAPAFEEVDGPDEPSYADRWADRFAQRDVIQEHENEDAYDVLQQKRRASRGNLAWWQGFLEPVGYPLAHGQARQQNH